MNNSDDDVIFDGCVGGANRGLNNDDSEESGLPVQSGNANPGITTDKNSTSSPEKENQQQTIEQEVNKELENPTKKCNKQVKLHQRSLVG